MSSIQGDEVLQMMIPTEHHATKTPLLSRLYVDLHQNLSLYPDARKSGATLSSSALLYR